MKNYIALLFALWLYCPLKAQKFYPPLGTLPVNDSLFVDFSFIGIDTWMAYLDEMGEKEKLNELQKNVPRRKREKTPILNTSSKEIEGFCQWRSGFVNNFKEKGSSDVPNCPANEIYAQMKKCDTLNLYKVSYRLPSQREYELIIQKIENDKSFQKQFRSTKEAELLKNNAVVKNNSFALYQKQMLAFRCVAVYIKK